MAKAKTAYVCDNCGYDSPKWVGRCPSCGQWNSFKEINVSPVASPSKGAAAVVSAGLNRQQSKPQRLSETLPKKNAMTRTMQNSIGCWEEALCQEV